MLPCLASFLYEVEHRLQEASLSKLRPLLAATCKVRHHMARKFDLVRSSHVAQGSGLWGCRACGAWTQLASPAGWLAVCVLTNDAVAHRFIGWLACQHSALLVKDASMPERSGRMFLIRTPCTVQVVPYTI